MEKLLEILSEIKPDVDFENETDLISNGIITSLDMVRIVNDITDEYDIDISVTDIIPENFRNAEAIMEMIKRLEDE